jgi:hypothetical protein
MEWAEQALADRNFGLGYTYEMHEVLVGDYWTYAVQSRVQGHNLYYRLRSGRFGLALNVPGFQPQWRKTAPKLRLQTDQHGQFIVATKVERPSMYRVGSEIWKLEQKFLKRDKLEAGK